MGEPRRPLAAVLELHLDELSAHVPDQLADVDHDEFRRATNRLRPDLIRAEADEPTYDRRIILRSEIEARDLPAIWAEKMRDLLDLKVPDDTRGVLQDVHWSHRSVGSFPTCTLGNVMSSQLFAAAQRTSAVSGGLDAGEYGSLADSLRENVWRHGRASTHAETLDRVTGGPLDPEPCIADLADKVAAFAA